MKDYFNISLDGSQLQSISSIGLAHLGDAVYELLVRSWLCAHGRATGKGLHRAAVELVKAPAQAQRAEKILPLLTEEELAVYKRGRNAHVHTIPHTKGIGRFLVINKHALRNAMVPIVTVIGMEIPVLFGGAVIVEQVFSWPGLGLMTMSAISGRDYPVIMGVCLLSAVVVLAANLITDILYALVDPAIQLD